MRHLVYLPAAIASSSTFRTTSRATASVEAELAQLEALREGGVITDEQYENKKEQLLTAN